MAETNGDSKTSNGMYRGWKKQWDCLGWFNVLQRGPIADTSANAGHVEQQETKDVVPNGTNGDHVDGEQEQEEDQNGGVFQISVKLPHEPYKIQVTVQLFFQSSFTSEDPMG